ncbi:hypothetical protein D3C83_130370 [compost metagenome]
MARRPRAALANSVVPAAWRVGGEPRDVRRPRACFQGRGKSHARLMASGDLADSGVLLVIFAAAGWEGLPLRLPPFKLKDSAFNLNEG